MKLSFIFYALFSDLATSISSICAMACNDEDSQLGRNAIQRCTGDAETTFLLGDIYYTDVQWSNLVNTVSSSSDAETLRRETLNAQGKVSSLINFENTHCTWDDHDFGLNDLGVDMVHKAQQQELFLNFCKVAADDPRRNRDGVYYNDTLPRASSDDLDVRVISFDMQYFNEFFLWWLDRSKFDVFGETQLQWFRDYIATLDTSVDVITILASHWLIGNPDYGVNAQVAEVLQLLKSVGKPVVIFSGDKHTYGIFQLATSRVPIIEIQCGSVSAPARGNHGGVVVDGVHVLGTPYPESSGPAPNTYCHAELERGDGGNVVIRAQVRNSVDGSIIAQHTVDGAQCMDEGGHYLGFTDSTRANIVDVVSLLRVIIDNSVPSGVRAAIASCGDVNNDGSTDILDVVQLLRYIISKRM